MGVYDYQARNLDGQEIPLSEFKGKVLLIVNTASKCGFTPQYQGLQALYQRYGERGLEILGFPCNQFGHQEPGDAGEIGAFCEKNYGVSFPMFDKIEVNGAQAHPLFKFLKAESPGVLGTQGIKWNFTKFLVDREGRVVRRYGSKDKPEKLADDIEKLL
ncbi:glutathione peroxidase [Alloalcanivorax mobilis]|uniref:glutathione peroxidase n=1 Tax=Alloalcanivorax mobilis TaxID=2019569 RepID=UPI000B5B39C2|nr:glutathione peroxidase [Alloalcanivorax mobilis]ASK35699.1 glutathione peroxidase [Alcanivorax sp. N3-2A]|tara:strand:- start:8168 stop:8644 length:477 start_codon:yes stop_codon:yes gene_type:complete